MLIRGTDDGMYDIAMNLRDRTAQGGHDALHGGNEFLLGGLGTDRRGSFDGVFGACDNGLGVAGVLFAIGLGLLGFAQPVVLHLT
jgi:hypothetical protein